MKGIIPVVFVLFLGCSYAVPIKPEEPRFVWFPDEQGVMHLIDLEDDTPPTIKFIPDEDIFYLLYTRKNPTEGQLIKKGDSESLAESNFDPTKPVKFTIHGWTADFTSGTNTKIRDAFLKLYDVNMITVDWGVGAQVGYTAAVRNAKLAGPSIAELLDWLNEQGVAFSNMHILGHSLGGQLTGLVGRACTRGQVEYITALDPANPSWGPTSDRIRKTDAKYLEVIHTNSGMLGMVDAVGHNDFFPNGGKNMPGCDGDIQCSHTRSTDYVAASIDHELFMGIECASVDDAMSGVDNCTGSLRLHLGGASIKPEMGIFALDTNAEHPYYQG